MSHWIKFVKDASDPDPTNCYHCVHRWRPHWLGPHYCSLHKIDVALPTETRCPEFVLKSKEDTNDRNNRNYTGGDGAVFVVGVVGEQIV